MQPSSGARKPTPPPTPSAPRGGGGGGGVFDDYSFRFSKTYTAVDSHERDAQASKAGTSFGLPRQPLHGASTQPVQTHTGPRSMLDYSASTGATHTAASTTQRGTGRAAKREVPGREGKHNATTTTNNNNNHNNHNNHNSLTPAPSRADRAAVDQAAATRVMTLLSSRRHITVPLPQAQDQPTSSFQTSSAAAPVNVSSTSTMRTEAAAAAASSSLPGARSVPATHALPVPVLGEAAGAVHMGAHGGPLSLSAEARAEVLNDAFARGELLFDAWQGRQQVRLSTARRRGVDQQLERALSEAVYGLLVQEEDYWIQTLSHSQIKGREMSVNPKLKPYNTTSTSAGQDLMARTNGLSVLGATSRGVTVPLDFMESLFKALRALLHQRTVTLLAAMRTNKQVQKEEDETARGKSAAAAAAAAAALTSPLSSSMRTAESTPAQVSREAEVNAELLARAEADEDAYVDALIVSETALGEQAVRDTEGSLLPSCVSLPPERIVAPVLSLETATSAVLLWKVLQQAQTVIPNTGFALTLYVHYILPHLYENFSLYARTVPQQLGSVSEQVRQLAELPLRARVDLQARETLQQATADVAYMETAMKTWALRTWRMTVLASRRTERQRQAFARALSGLRRRTRVKQVFAAWRLAARESAQQTYMGNIESEYRTFLNASDIVAQVERFPLLGAGGGGGGSGGAGDANGDPRTRLGGTAYNRAKFLATKLAESAEHRKPGKPVAQSLTRPASPVRLPPVLPLRERVVSYTGDVEERDGARPAPVPVGNAPVMDTPPLPDAMVMVPAHAAPPMRTAAVVPLTIAATADATEAEDTAFSVRSFQATSTTTFDTMLRKLREMEEVCSHLQSEIAIQNGRVAKLEQEKYTLTDRTRTLETKLLEALDEKLHYCNVVQEKQLLLNDRNRRIAQLKSRLRAHRHRPWQKTVLRVMGECCGASTQLSERADELRLFRASTSAAASAGSGAGAGAGAAAAAGGGRRTKQSKSGSGVNAKSDKNSGATASGMVSALDANALEHGADEEGDGEAAFAAQNAEEQEDHRLFSRLAPIVLSTTQNLPDALVILRDWANSCLDDLETLDDIKGGALSLRITTFSEELRNGVLLSRLLYYLALPRYLHSNGAGSSGASGDEDGSGAERDRRRQHGSAAVRQQLLAAAMGRGGGSETDDLFAPNFSERRGQLLEKRQVQLETPFPVYSECFGDLLNMRLSDRMTLLLRFATELVMSQGRVPATESAEAANAKLCDVLYTTLGLSAPPAACRLELTEVIDPHALSMGERASSVTFIALLYTRFSHPFNHKCKQSAALERAGVLSLLSGGQWVQEERARLSLAGGVAATSVSSSPSMPAASMMSTSAAVSGLGAAPLSTVEQELLACLDDEDKSPWQLFKERCLPVFGSAAHPFLLRGNFWPSEAFESPDLAELLGELGMALNRSLQAHRWHVTLSCLVPVLTFSGLSRGVFTGPRASPTALRVGLERDGQWEFPLGYDYLERIFDRRVGRIQQAVVAERINLSALLRAPTLEERESSLYYASATGSSKSSAAHAGFGASRSDAPDGSRGRSPSPTATPDQSTHAAARQPRGSFFVPPSAGRRETAIGTAAATHRGATPASVLVAIRSRERAALMASLQLVLDDVLSLFAARATLNAELALPVMDLASWRLFCADMQLIQLLPSTTSKAASASASAAGEENLDSREDVSRPVKLLSMEMASHVFQLAVLSYLDIDLGAAAQDTSLPTADGTAVSATATSLPDLLAVMPHSLPATPAHGASRSPPSAISVPPSAGSSPGAPAGLVALPTVRSYMTFPAFAMALTLVADQLYPDVAAPLPDDEDAEEEEEDADENADEDPRAGGRGRAGLDVEDAPTAVAAAFGSQPPAARKKRYAVRWLGDALSHLVQGYMVTNAVLSESSPGSLMDDPRSVITRLTGGLRTQEMLNWYSPCIVAVYNAYSREVYGLAALQCEDMMRLLRDAMLTSTEISQYLITELFQHCAVTRTAREEAVIAKRRDIDGKPREGNAGANAVGGSGASGADKRKGGRSVRIVDPRGSTASAATTSTTDVKVLNYDGFVQLLCVLCVFKQPNPLVAFDQRLSVFLRRSLLRPLTHKVDGLAMLLNRSKLTTRSAPGTKGDDKNDLADGIAA